MPREHYHFVTGRLAEPGLLAVVAELAPRVGFDYSIQVLPITVAALMSPKWIARRIEVPSAATRVMIPGHCRGDLTPLLQAVAVPVELGPRDLRELPEVFGQQPDRSGYGSYDIELVAKIPRAFQLPLETIATRAAQWEADGADRIALAGDPHRGWPGIEEAVRTLVGQGQRVALENCTPADIERAVRAGADLVLSVDQTTCRHAPGWGCQVVAVPDAPGTLQGLEETVHVLEAAKVAYRIQPLLNPIGFGFAASLACCLEGRRRWPQAEMLLDLSPVTELTEVDSAGGNLLLLGWCQELGIRSVLTSQENNWTRSAVRECHRARQLVHHAVTQRVLPRHLDRELLILRDVRLWEHGPERLRQLVEAIKDRSFRIFVEGGRLHVVCSGVHLEGENAYDLLEQMMPPAPETLDPRYAFYLGYEMSKAATALTLGKNYHQDEALDWGLLTRPELTRLERRALRQARRRNGDCDDAPEEPAG